MTKKAPNPTPEPLVDELENDSTTMTNKDGTRTIQINKDGTRTRIFQLKEDEVVINWEHLRDIEKAYFSLCGLEYIFRNAPPGSNFDGNKNYHSFSFLLRLITEKMKPAMDAM